MNRRFHCSVRNGVAGGGVFGHGSGAASAALACQAAVNRPAGAVGGPVDGGVEVGLCFADDDIGHVRKDNLDLAAFVGTTTGAVDIREPDDDAQNLVVTGIQGEIQASLDMAAQRIGQGETVGVNIKAHNILLAYRDERRDFHEILVYHNRV